MKTYTSRAIRNAIAEARSVWRDIQKESVKDEYLLLWEMNPYIFNWIKRNAYKNECMSIIRKDFASKVYEYKSIIEGTDQGSSSDAS